MKFNFNILKKITFCFSLSLVTISSFIYIYNQRTLIVKLLYPQYERYQNNNNDGSPKDKEIAKKLLKGGYILHFRHAEREKWIDVAMYDSLESDIHDNGFNQPRYAENDYFKNAVCLNSRGEIQAKAIGEHLKNIKLPIGFVISSTSCRSRQTAELAFNGYDNLDRNLVHTGPYSENKLERINKLKNLYNSLKIIDGKNTIVSAHNGVIMYQMFENSNDPNLFLEEGGFYVISRKNNKLYLEHEYNNFNDFIKLFYKK